MPVTIHDTLNYFTIVSCCFENSYTVSECWFYSSQMLLTGNDPPLLQLLQLWLNFKFLVLSSFLYTINMFETSVANAPWLRLVFNQYTVGSADFRQCEIFFQDDVMPLLHQVIHIKIKREVVGLNEENNKRAGVLRQLHHCFKIYIIYLFVS